MKITPDRDLLLKLFTYDPDSGVLVRKIPRGMGGPAGSKMRGYLQIGIKGVDYFAHRLVWKMYYGKEPSGDIDHINGVRSDNSIKNLREVTDSQNLHNCGLRKNNTSGVKGASFNKTSKKWVATVIVRGERNYLGVFKELKDAEAALKNFRRENLPHIHEAFTA